MIAWLLTHWIEVAVHLALDVSGGLTLKCAMGVCEHPRHQALVWMIGCLLISISTVVLIG